jgi:YVTN family beta-propeller protein
VYVTHTRDGPVSVIDARTNAVTATVPGITHPLAIEVDALTNTVYVVQFRDNRVNRVAAIDGRTLQVKGTVPVGGAPVGLAHDPLRHRLYTTNSRDGSVSVIDTRALRVTATVSEVGPFPRGVTVVPVRGTVYVSTRDNRTVTTIRAER